MVNKEKIIKEILNIDYNECSEGFLKLVKAEKNLGIVIWILFLKYVDTQRQRRLKESFSWLKLFQRIQLPIQTTNGYFCFIPKI